MPIELRMDLESDGPDICLKCFMGLRFYEEIQINQDVDIASSGLCSHGWRAALDELAWRKPTDQKVWDAPCRSRDFEDFASMCLIWLLRDNVRFRLEN